MQNLLRCLYISLLLALSVLPALAQPEIALLSAVDLALNQSDTSKDLVDSLQLSQMDISTAEHKFTTKLVPLTNIGFVQGTGSQRLGMEFRRDTQTGSAVSYGLVANHFDENGNYVVTNPLNARAYVKISQGFFRRWGTQYNLKDLNVAQLRTKENETSAERAKQALILQTVTSYYELVLAKQLQEKATQALERSKKNLATAKAKQAVGLVSKVDVYRANLASLNSQRVLTDRKRQRRKAHDALRNLLRLNERETLLVTDTISMMAPIIPDSWEENLFESRPDWQAQRIDLEINRLEMIHAKQNLLPDIGLSFTLEQKGEGDTFSEAIELDQTNWSIQFEMLSDLDSFQEENAVERNRLKRAKLLRAQAALRRRIHAEVNEAFEDLMAEEQKYRISLQSLNQAGEALDLAKVRYERGLSDNFDIITAENSYSEAELATVRSIRAYNIASVSLAYKLGVLNRKWLELSLVKDGKIAKNLTPHMEQENGWQ